MQEGLERKWVQRDVYTCRFKVGEEHKFEEVKGRVNAAGLSVRRQEPRHRRLEKQPRVEVNELISKLNPNEKSRKRQIKSTGNSIGGETTHKSRQGWKNRKFMRWAQNLSRWDAQKKKNLRHSSGAGTDHNMQNSLGPERKERLLVTGCSWFRCSPVSCPGEPSEGDKQGEVGEREWKHGTGQSGKPGPWQEEPVHCSLVFFKVT